MEFKKMKVMGIDIASGKGTSAIGYAVIDQDDKLINFNYIAPKKTRLNLLYELSEHFRYLINHNNIKVLAIETTHYRNANVNDLIHQTIGAVAACCPKVYLIHNTVLKKAVTGNSRATKDEIVEKVLNAYSSNKRLQDLFTNEDKYRYDVTDAIALASCGNAIVKSEQMDEEIKNIIMEAK